MTCTSKPPGTRQRWPRSEHDPQAGHLRRVQRDARTGHIDWTIIGDTKELNVYGAHLGPYCYPLAIDMLNRGLLPMDQIITHQLPLSSFQDGIDLIASGKKSIKVTLRPESSEAATA